MYFDFNEINIIMQNITEPNLPKFMEVLSVLEENTKDMVLRSSIRSLKEKLLTIAPNNFHTIYEDIKKGSIVTTEGYYLELYQ